eukprot:m.874106 g.874106  ORF g.874106 m.874106 type:complete len:924 (+) comp59795_c0_seq1:489-3260(+)
MQRREPLLFPFHSLHCLGVISWVLGLQFISKHIQATCHSIIQVVTRTGEIKDADAGWLLAALKVLIFSHTRPVGPVLQHLNSTFGLSVPAKSTPGYDPLSPYMPALLPEARMTASTTQAASTASAEGSESSNCALPRASSSESLSSAPSKAAAAPTAWKTVNPAILAKPAAAGSSERVGGSSRKQSSTQRDSSLPRRSQMFSGASSESEFSDAERSAAAKLRHAASHLRLSVLLCLQCVLKTLSKKALYSYWASFIPDALNPGTQTLFTLLIQETDPKVRAAVAYVVSILLDGSAAFLALADDTPRQGAFTSHAQSLGSMITAVHSGLLAALSAESSSFVLVHSLKTLALLIRNTPYDRLKNNSVEGPVDKALALLRHSEPEVVVAAVACIASVFRAKVPPASASVHQRSLNAILPLCAASWPLPVRVEVLQSLRECCAAHPNLFVSQFNDLQPMLRTSFDSGDSAIRLHLAKLLEEVSRSGLGIVPAVDQQIAEFTQEILLRCGPAFMHEAHSTLRVGILDLVAALPERLFVLFTEQAQQQLVDLTRLFCAATQVPDKSAAIRAVGLLMLHSTIRRSRVDFEKSLQLLLSLLPTSVENAVVHLRVCSALGNACEALARNTAEDQATAAVDRPDVVMHLTQLIDVMMSLSKENDKIRPTAIRALGTLVRIAPPDHIASNSALLKQIATILQSNAISGQVKTRWNACHALGCLMQHPAFLSLDSESSAGTFAALLNCLSTSPNFKVRINAATALGTPTRRETFGAADQLSGIVQVALSVLDSSAPTTFSEAKYAKTLNARVRTTLCHLFALSTPKDEAKYETFLALHADPLLQALQAQAKSLQPDDGATTRSSEAKGPQPIDRDDDAAELDETAPANLQAAQDEFLQACEVVLRVFAQSAQRRVALPLLVQFQALAAIRFSLPS